MKLKLLMTLMLLALALMVGCAAEEPAPPPPPAEEAPPPPPPPPASATVTLTSRADAEVAGSISFTEVEGGVAIAAEISGLTPGAKHGFHIHETGDCSAEDFTSAGGHYNPAGVDHAGPDAESSHAGDLGNLEAGEDGTASYESTSAQLTVAELNGLAVIVHAGEDDLTSQPTGAAGGRLACAVIGAGAGDAAEGDAGEGEAEAPEGEGDAAEAGE